MTGNLPIIITNYMLIPMGEAAHIEFDYLLHSYLPCTTDDNLVFPFILSYGRLLTDNKAAQTKIPIIHIIFL